MSIPAPLSVTHSGRADTELYGYNIPANSMIIPNLYSACMDSKYWKQPEQFKPERFLNEEGKIIKAEAFIPFSTGMHLRFLDLRDVSKCKYEMRFSMVKVIPIISITYLGFFYHTIYKLI